MEAWRGLQVSRGGLAVGMTMAPTGLCIIAQQQIEKKLRSSKTKKHGLTNDWLLKSNGSLVD